MDWYISLYHTMFRVIIIIKKQHVTFNTVERAVFVINLFWLVPLLVLKQNNTLIQLVVSYQYYSISCTYRCIRQCSESVSLSKNSPSHFNTVQQAVLVLKVFWLVLLHVLKQKNTLIQLVVSYHINKLIVHTVVSYNVQSHNHHQKQPVIFNTVQWAVLVLK